MAENIQYKRNIRIYKLRLNYALGENSNFAFKVNRYADENTLNQIFTHVKYKQFPVVTEGQEEPGPLKQECKKKNVSKVDSNTVLRRVWPH